MQSETRKPIRRSTSPRTPEARPRPAACTTTPDRPSPIPRATRCPRKRTATSGRPRLRRPDASGGRLRNLVAAERHGRPRGAPVVIGNLLIGAQHPVLAEPVVVVELADVVAPRVGKQHDEQRVRIVKVAGKLEGCPKRGPA